MATLPLRRTPTSERALTGTVRPVDTSVDTSAEDRATQNLGATISGIGENIQKEQDASAIFAMRRKLDDWERTAIYDPQAGAVSKKGADAFDLPKKLPEDFDKFAGQLGQEVSSPRQKQALQELITSRRAQIGDFAARHSTQQRQVYNEGQYNADIDSSLNRAAMLASAGDFATAKAETGLAQTRTVGYLRSLGKSEEEISVAVRNVSSKANVTAINMLLEKDKPLEADKYLKDNAAGMNVEDLLRAQAAVGKSVDARVGLVTATEIVQGSVIPAVQPTDSARLVNLVMGAESGGKRFGPDGKTLLTSPKGAKGEMQVMDGTNKNPGYGVTPAKDDSPDERARVGREYLGAMVKEFGGDVPKALAAYNAGPGAVQKAMEAAAKGRSGSGDWLSYMPEETKAYVGKITNEYSKGAGAPQLPSLQDLHAQVRAKVSMDSPQRYKTAIDEVNRQYGDALAAKKQTEEANTTAAYDWLVKNKGDYARMPPSLLSNLPPGKVDDTMAFAGKIAAGVPIQTDWTKYTELRAMAVQNPAQFAKVNLLSYYPSIAPAQREQLVDLQTKVNDPKSQPTVVSLEKQLSVAHEQLGITKSDSKKGMFDNAVTEAVAAEQRDKKRELTFEERDKIIKRMQLPTTSGFFSTDKVYEVTGTAKEAGAKLKITSEEKTLITQALTAAGKPVNDANIQAVFNIKQGSK
jgi:soluble lytic murein transglycosylase-like protein